MTVIKIENFGGMLPVQDERILPANYAANADGARLYSGALTGYNPPTLVHTLSNTSARSVFHIPLVAGLPSSVGTNQWLEFTDINTDVIKAPSINDQYYRYYFASPSQVPQYNTLDRIRTGQSPFTLGIPTPETAPGVTPVAGTQTALVRSYVYTWVSAYGEEGAPSPPTLGTGKIDSTNWAITVTPPLTVDTANRNLTKTRIYRTVTGTNGVASFFLVAEIPIANTSYNDTTPDTSITGGTQLPGTIYTGPPSDLQGMVTMPNGMVAGWVGNDIWFCEPYLPHAWPAAYTVSVEYPIVGLGVIGSSLVACTEGYPYAATGNAPSVMSFSKIQIDEPCLSKGSIVSTIEGVYYASMNGLIKANPLQVVNVTRPACDNKAWQSLVDPANLRAVRFNDSYLSFSVPPSSMTQGLLVDSMDQRVAFTKHNPALTVNNIQQDLFSTSAIFISGTGVYTWDTVGATPPLPYVWKSKKFQLPYSDNLSAGKIYFNIPTGLSITPTSPSANTLGETFGANMYLLLNVYADDRLVLTWEVQNSGDLIRLPSGFKADVYQFEVYSRVNITSMQFGTSVKELRTQ